MRNEPRNPLILLADDDAASRLVLYEALELEDFHVIEADDGVGAVEAYARERPQMVVLDVIMPGMDGFEACAAIRNLPGGDSVPILMLTGLEDLDSIRKGFEAGATDFATKPLNWMILSQRVRYMIRASETLGHLRESESRLAEAQRLAHLGSWDRDPETGVVRWSDEAYRIFGVRREEFTPTLETILECVHPDDRSLVAQTSELARKDAGTWGLDFRIVRADGSVRYLHEQLLSVRDEEGRSVRLSGVTLDITERKNAEQRIRTLAYYDTLTHLPNRQLFLDRLEQSIERARRVGEQVAVLFMDLDQFKRINDTLGHRCGDQLLQAVADRLMKSLRTTDTLARAEALGVRGTVARLGGDEFIVSLADIGRGEDAAKVARRVLESLQRPFRIADQEVFVSASIGISLFPQDGNDVESLLRNADTAMYHAKDSDRSNFQFYNQSMNASAFQRLSLENSLRKALERDEFILHFQPVLDARTGAVVGAEALLRWKHPDMGLVPPGDFIPLAEETGLIVPIGEWVLRTAWAQGMFWRGGDGRPLHVAVNLSPRQFRQQQLVEIVSRILKETGIDPSSLVVEITESALMRDEDEAVRTLSALRAMRLRVAVDDFGTGYSSLGRLKRFPIDSLKIDRSFVRDMVDDPASAAITSAIVSMARGLGLTVVAEGVENERQLDLLRDQGCHMVQGYLLGRPVTADELSERLRSDRAGVAAGVDSIPVDADAGS